MNKNTDEKKSHTTPASPFMRAARRLFFGLDESKVPSIAKGVATLVRPMNGQKLEVIIINEELGY